MTMVSGGGTTGNKVPQGVKYGQLQQFTPEMMELFKQLFSHVGPDSFLSKLAGGDESMFEQIEAPQKTQFAGQMGNLASRFSGSGQGGRHGSGFQHATTQAGSDFSQQLGAQRMGLQNQAIKDLFGMSNTLLGQKPYEQFLFQKPPKQGDSSGAQWGKAGGDILSSILPMLLAAL